MAGKRVSFGKNVKPTKVYIKGLEELPGKTVGLVMNQDACLHLAENSIRAARVSDQVDVTLFAKAKVPVLTVTAETKALKTPGK